MVCLNTFLVVAFLSTENIIDVLVRALIFGSQHFMTFDKNFLEFRGACTYLLAHDFMDGNFSLAISYDRHNKGETYVLHLIIGRKNLININVFSNVSLQIKGNGCFLKDCLITDCCVWKWKSHLASNDCREDLFVPRK